MNQLSKDRPVIQSLLSALEQLSTCDLPTEAQDKIKTVQQGILSLSEEIEELQAEAQQARQDKLKFISVVTHELRIPLTSIKGYTDLLRQGIVGTVNEQQTNFLTVIRNNVDRMSALISNLGDLSHLQSGRLKLQPASYNFHQEIEAFISPWKARIAAKEQSFHVELDPDIPAMHLDPGRFHQILDCLLSNAHNYTAQGGDITLRALRTGEQVRIEVQDNGIGISEADQSRVFEPFFRSEDPQVRESPGWGLSLHVAKNLVHLMGGNFGFQSQLHQGSTFWFTVPIST